MTQVHELLFNCSATTVHIKPGEFERAEAFGGRILEVCVEVGGTITGVGIEKLNQMCVQFKGTELEQFQRLNDFKLMPSS
jgi:FAD/FMN-containing dehydrogenase